MLTLRRLINLRKWDVSGILGDFTVYTIEQDDE